MYFSIGNGQPVEPALCQLYRHTFVPYKHTWTQTTLRTTCVEKGHAYALCADDAVQYTV